ncbi:hypothetical protein ZOSMA_26G01480 [Zostera marina]|uniref:Peptidase S9A N-terminal domain-containing protein n=1 Tax=Zostera marina TaxID=29655 RepID=A0A0K9PGL7_ZOSMR|nr:hypothetical protein ZOSMA_26G01480 [Zostera marina]
MFRRGSNRKPRSCSTQTSSERMETPILGYTLSEDGEYLAYGLNSSGSDWVTIQVMRVKDKKELEDTLHWIKFSNINWTHDGKGFFYCRFPAPTKEGDAGTETSLNLHHQLYYHFLGTDQSEDILCWTDPSDPKYIFEAKVTSDGKVDTR